jgi:D-alanine-D-alanine ligase
VSPGFLPPIVVLFGGPSAEHDVSIVSGTAIADALGDRGHDVRQVFLDLDGGWWWLPADHRRGDRTPAAYDDPSAIGAEGPLPVGRALDRLAGAPGDPRPVAFIALHGPFGEDGTIQALLEAAGVPYTGAGVAASAIGMDKALFKRLARGLGLPVVEWREVSASRWGRDRDGVLGELDAFARGLAEERLMVKPARLGSSVGMTIAHTVAERAPALDEAFRFDSLALVERYLRKPRELEVSVVGNDAGDLEQYGPGEVIAGREFYDYVAKYTPGMSETSLTAELEPRERNLVLKFARDAYRAAGVEGFARVDFLLASDGQVYLSEINTIPGFTPISLFPTLPSSAGLDFADVCERIVELALERHAGRRTRRLTAADLPRARQ